MNDLPAFVRALVIVVVVIAGGVNIYFYARTLRQVSKSDLSPGERKKWLRRVLLLRGIGWVQWEQFRRKHGVTSRGQEPEDEGLNSAPPPGSE
jgi:hypothetical protein